MLMADEPNPPAPKKHVTIIFSGYSFVFLLYSLHIIGSISYHKCYEKQCHFLFALCLVLPVSTAQR